MAEPLPIDALRASFEESIQAAPVVITAPTGTGKSTQVPRWLLPMGRPGSPVLVVQPRRVAARAVADRIAVLEGLKLGQEVGYRVRDDDCSSASTRLLVVTPGIALSRPALLGSAALVVLDEVHERRLDTDLLLALLVKSERAFVAMSATMDGDAVAKAVGGRHLSVSARTYPVEVDYIDSSGDLPSADDLDMRLNLALDRLKGESGDILVFLPGKSEIERAARLLESRGEAHVCLHGGLTLKQQAQVLAKGTQRRIIVSTNVAETSLTIPGVTAVVDGGLVRRTSYHAGRSYLTLAPVALDSAEQRAGRAGRVAKGRCIRLWGSQARLQSTTPPEIHREELSSLVLTCAQLEVAPEELPFLDAPKDYALADAVERLTALGAVIRDAGEPHRLTSVGKELAGLPLDPWLSRFLVEARSAGCLGDAIDLAAALEQPRAGGLSKLAPEDELVHPACDAMALVTLLRSGAPNASAQRTLSEAKKSARRLRRALGSDEAASPGGLDRTRLLKTLLKADPQAAHVSRRRKKRIVFSNGGTEMEVGRDSRLFRLLSSDHPKDQVDALLVLETHGVSSGKDHRLLITAAAPIPLSWLAEMKLGSLAVKQAQLPKSGPNRGQLVVLLERSFAGRVIETTEERPTGEHARSAIAQLFLRGSLHKKASALARSRLARRALALELGRASEFAHFRDCTTAPSLEAWILEHLEELGVESGEDLKLLSAEDFVPEDVPAELAPQLDDRFPLQVDLGDTLYAAEYDLKKRQVMLSTVRGGRKAPPPAQYLPRFEGFRVFVEAGGTFHPVKR